MDNTLLIISKFVKKHNIKMNVRPGPPTRPYWSKDAHHYICTLRRPGAKMQVTFSMGAAHSYPPDVETVLENLIADTQSMESCNYDHDTFAKESGYSSPTESKRIFNAIKRQTNRLKKFLSYNGYGALVKNINEDINELHNNL